MTRFSTRFVLSVVAGMFCCFSNRGAAEVPKPEQLLARYEAYVDGLRSISFDTLQTVSEKGGPFKDWTWDWITQASFVRTGECWRLRNHVVGFNFYDRLAAVNVVREDVFDGKSYFMVIRDDRGARKLTSMNLEDAQRLLQGDGLGPWKMDVSAEIEAEKPEAARRYFIRGEVADLYGYVYLDGITIDDMLRQRTSRLTSGLDTIEGRACHVLKGVTKYGIVTLWLDAALDDVPIRLHLWKQGSDLMDNTPMRAMKASSGLSTRPNLPMRQYELQVDFQPEPIQGRTFPAKYSRLDRLVYEGGQVFLTSQKFRLDHVRFDPKPEDVEPTLPIPEETPVYLINGPGIPSKWSQGKLVKGYDKSVVVSLKGKWFSEVKTVPLWRRPLVVTAAILLFLLCGLLAWRNRSAKDARK